VYTLEFEIFVTVNIDSTGPKLSALYRQNYLHR